MTAFLPTEGKARFESAMEIALRFSDSRPGCELIGYQEVGLPIHRIQIDASFLESKDISPIDEFVLRGISAGLGDSAELAEFLGLPEKLLVATMADMARRDEIELIASGGNDRQVLSLTSRGHMIVEKSERIVPLERIVTICFDGLTRSAIPEPIEKPFSPIDLRRIGARELPSFPSRPPELQDLDRNAVSQVLLKSGFGRGKRSPQLVSINRLVRRQRLYRRAVALAYRSYQGDRLELAFAVDGRLSPSHDTAFSRANGLTKTGLLLKLSSPSDTAGIINLIGQPAFDNAAPLERVRSVVREVSEAQRRVDQLQSSRNDEDLEPALGPTQEEVDSAYMRLQSAKELQNSIDLRFVDVGEYPGLLRFALENASREVIIVCPHVQSIVLEEEFNRLAALAARSNVRVNIAITQSSSVRDSKALQQLTAFANQDKRFVLSKLDRNYPAALICDDRFAVVTNFDWLGYRGEPLMPMEQRSGILTTQSELIAAISSRLKRELSIS